MKEKMKYIVALLIATTISVVFLPILNIGNTEITAFDIIKIGLMNYEDSILEQTIMSVMDSNIEMYAYIASFVFLLILFNAVVVATLNARTGYGYAIISGIVVNIIMFIGYSCISDEIEEIETAIQFFGQEEYIFFCEESGMLWGICYVLVLLLSCIGIIMFRIGDKKKESEEIIPEEFYCEKNPWENKPRKVLLQDRENQIQISEREIKFYGALLGENRMFSNKVYLLEERIPVYVVRKENIIFILKYDSTKENIKNHMLDEVLAEIYYVSEYQEYVVKPFEKLKVYLESGQPLGKERLYYLPRATEIYFEDSKWKFVLA